jgi:hypothetical protein
MNLQESNKIRMFTASKEELDLHASEIENLPALKAGAIKLGEGIRKIWDMDKKFDDKSSRMGEAKTNIRNAMIAKANNVAGNIYAYATNTRNDDLKAKVKMTEHTLRAMRDADLQTKVQNIYDLAETNIASLGDYGVKAADVSEMEQLIEAFTTTNRNMGSNKADRSSARTALTVYFDEVDVLLDDVIDKLIENFRISDPQFYSAYQAARVIYDIGGGHSAEIPPVAAAAAAK